MSAAWAWPLDLGRYDRASALSPAEAATLAALVARFGPRHPGHWARAAQGALGRLASPLLDALAVTGAHAAVHAPLVKVMVREMHHRQRSYWAWTPAEWRAILCPSIAAFARRHRTTAACRASLIAVVYLLGGVVSLADLQALGAAERTSLARKVFGRAAVDAALARVLPLAVGWGYGEIARGSQLGNATCEALLVNRSPRLEDLSAAFIDALLQGTTAAHRRAQLLVLSRALHGLGFVDRTYARDPRRLVLKERHRITDGVAPAWVAWCRRWRDTSAVGEKTRIDYYYLLLKAGHWLARHHPAVTDPEQWTRELAAAYVAAVCRMTVGEYGPVTVRYRSRVGEPLSPKSRLHHLDAVRTFFRDALAWEWFAPRFDPRRCLAAPRSLRALVGPNPRVIADDIWAKLLWAGLNLAQEDLPVSKHATEHYYPLAMVQALTMAWLFAGLRANEIRRLRVGCARWQARDGGLLDTSRGRPEDAVCLLDVPVNKTETAFTKPVDRVVGEAIAAWEAVRPAQPALRDPKTGEATHFLFAYRAKPVGAGYLNASLIPLLCRKAGVPERDARGTITSHRARSTISSQLFNAREPMSLFDLQAWLGHRSPASTQHYARISPTKLAKSYEDAGYFGRNLRAVELLLDRDAVQNGAAATGEPWRFYDLGHGYCTYDFFDQCPHRMACAKCAFYRPKGSSAAQLLEGKANLLRLRQEIPLSDEEQAAVEDGVAAHERLLAQLADIPTPAGPTPRELGGDRGGAGLPAVPAAAPARHALPVLPAHAP